MQAFIKIETAVALCAMLIASSGCASSKKAYRASGDAFARFEKGTTSTYRRSNAHQTRSEAHDDIPDDAKAPTERGARAEKIADEVAKLDEVSSASALISGNVALVGIQGDFSGDFISLKKKVIEKVKEVDPEIDEVSVTRDRDIINRMKSLSEAGIGEDYEAQVNDLYQCVN
jgi:YhcN/YlaJ family sporulation lipoprotein